MAIPDGGAGASGAPGFDPGSRYYNPGEVDTSCPALQGGVSGESLLSALWSGGGGTRSAVESAMKAANPDGLTTKAAAWDAAMSDVDGYTGKLAGAYQLLRGAWQGDDADQAMQTLGGLHATLADQIGHTGSMGSSLRSMASELSACKASWGHDNSTLGGFGNWVTGDDDRAAASDYNRMIANMSGAMEQMPHSVPTQVKPAAAVTVAGDYPTPGSAGPGGAPSVGGPAGAAHMGDPAAARIGQPGMADPHVGNPREEDPRFPGEHPPDEGLGNPPYGGGSGVADPVGGAAGGEAVPPIGMPGGAGGAGVGAGGGFAGGEGTGVAPVGSTGMGVAPVGSTLAGYSGAGGAGGAAGAGGLGAGGVIPGGADGVAGSLGAGGGLNGGAVLAGASGAGGAGGEDTRSTTVPGGGSAAAGVGAGTDGSRGMFPMRSGALGGDDEDERERTTWLVEDDEVWGGDETASSVIVR